MSLRSELESKAYAEVPAPVSEQQVDELFLAFDAFLSIAPDVKRAGNYSLPGLSNGDFGYFRRIPGSSNDGRSMSLDKKHVYHFGSGSRQQFEACDYSNLPKEVRDFCDISEQAYWQTVSSLKRILRQLRDEASGYGFRSADHLEPYFINGTYPLNIHQRLISAEMPSNPNRPITEHHYDRSVFTIHTKASQPGFEVGFKGDGSDLSPASQPEGQALFFAGGGWRQMPAKTQLDYDFIKPAYHGVRRPASTAHEAGRVARKALVTFANPFELQTDPAYAQTHPHLETELAA